MNKSESKESERAVEGFQEADSSGGDVGFGASVTQIGAGSLVSMGADVALTASAQPNEVTYDSQVTFFSYSADSLSKYALVLIENHVLNFSHNLTNFRVIFYRL